MRYLLTVDNRVYPVPVHRCMNFLARLRGMLMCGAGCREDAWYLQPCSAVHTLMQWRAIDVVFCDAGGRVLHIRRSLAPRRFARCRGAHSAWEFGAGQAARWQLAPGQQLHCRSAP